MTAFYARHSLIIDIDQATRDRLLSEAWVAIHYPEDIHGVRQDKDNDSWIPEEYWAWGVRAMRSLVRLTTDGGFVCAQYSRNDGPDRFIIGTVPPGAKKELMLGTWRSKPNHPAILKGVRLQDAREITVATHPQILSAIRPARGTLSRWKVIGTLLEDAI